MASSSSDELFLEAAGAAKCSRRASLSLLYTCNKSVAPWLSERAALHRLSFSQAQKTMLRDTPLTRKMVGKVIGYSIASACRGASLLRQQETTAAASRSSPPPPLLPPPTEATTTTAAAATTGHLTFEGPPGTIPAVTITDYIGRYLSYVPANEEVFLLSLIFIDRLLAATNRISLTLRTAHRLWAAAFVVASKVADDHFFSNTWYSKVAGLPLEEMNALEVEFLIDLQFSLNVSADEYSIYQSHARGLAAASCAAAVQDPGLLVSFAIAYHHKQQLLQQQQQLPQEGPSCPPTSSSSQEEITVAQSPIPPSEPMTPRPISASAASSSSTELIWVSPKPSAMPSSSSSSITSPPTATGHHDSSAADNKEATIV